MTGSGVATGDTQLGLTTVELRSVNGRSLGIKLRLCPECYGLDAALETLLRSQVQRGTLTLAIQILSPTSDTESLVDMDLALQVAAQLKELAQKLQVPKQVTLGDVLAFPGVIPSASINPSLNNHKTRLSWQPPEDLAALVQEALDNLLDSRRQEGQATVAAMGREIDAIEATLDEVVQLVPGVVANHRQRLLQRVNEFLEGQARAMEDQDVLREVALFADRVDITEELQRTRTHIHKLRQFLQEGGQIGRSVEFLLQELLREVNTLGSKSPDADISHRVVQMKSGIDKLKEQAANLE